MLPVLWPFRSHPWWFMSPTVTMNVQADNWDYSPMTEWGQGDLDVERQIGREAASYGRQIGILSEAILELAKKSDHMDGPAVRRLEELSKMVEEIKLRFPPKPVGMRTISNGGDAPASNADAAE